MPRKILILCTSLMLVAGCDFITKAQGVMELAKEVGTHLETDLKGPLTDEKIDKVLEVTPELVEFTKTAKEAWTPDPQGQDIAQLAASLGALSEYIAFFKARDTRITEFYVDLIKITDARWQIVYSEANEKAREQLATRKEQLEADTAMPAEAKKKALEQIELASQQLEKAKLAKAEDKPEQPASGKNAAYTLTDEEIALVAARLTEVTDAFKKAGYIKDEPVEADAPSKDGSDPK